MVTPPTCVCTIMYLHIYIYIMLSCLWWHSNIHNPLPYTAIFWPKKEDIGSPGPVFWCILWCIPGPFFLGLPIAISGHTAISKMQVPDMLQVRTFEGTMDHLLRSYPQTFAVTSYQAMSENSRGCLGKKMEYTLSCLIGRFTADYGNPYEQTRAMENHKFSCWLIWRKQRCFLSSQTFYRPGNISCDPAYGL